MRPIRIVHVVGQLDVGGMEKLLVEFARRADRTRFDLRFISLGRRGVVADEIESLGWPVIALDREGGVDGMLMLKLHKLFRHLRADVVHTHNTRPLLYSALAARFAGVATVIHTRHGQGYGSPPREQMMLRMIARLATHVVCVSHDSERIARQNGLPGRRLRTIWNGIDLSRFSPASEPSGPVLAIGRLSPEKDFATLIRAAAIAVTAAPAFQLHIAGDGACMVELRELVTQLNLHNVVKLLGQRSDVPQLLKTASLVALASVTEGVSLTLLEAMAAGLPVVATTVGGNPEVVEDGVTGLLVPPKAPEVLAAALVSLWTSPERRRAMGKAGRARVEQNFDVQQMVAKYEKLYLNDSEPGPSS